MNEIAFLSAPDSLSGANSPDDSLEEMDHDTCLEWLASLDIGRIAWAEGGRVMVFPLNFAFDGDDIVIRTASETVIKAVASSHHVTFQGDDIETAVRVGWTVVVSGPAEEVTDPAEVARLTLLVQPWRGAEDLRVLRIHVHHVAGRRLRVRPGSVEGVYLDP